MSVGYHMLVIGPDEIAKYHPFQNSEGVLAKFWMCCGSSIGNAQGGGAGRYLARQIVHGGAEINMLCLDPRRFGIFADADYTRTKSFQD